MCPGTGRAGADILSRALNGRLDIHRGEDEYMIRNKKSKKQQLNGGDSDVTDSDSEAEDLRILPTDLVILAARSEDEVGGFYSHTHTHAHTSTHTHTRTHTHTEKERERHTHTHIAVPLPQPQPP